MVILTFKWLNTKQVFDANLLVSLLRELVFILEVWGAPSKPFSG